MTSVVTDAAGKVTVTVQNIDPTNIDGKTLDLAPYVGTSTGLVDEHRTSHHRVEVRPRRHEPGSGQVPAWLLPRLIIAAAIPSKEGALSGAPFFSTTMQTTSTRIVALLLVVAAFILSHPYGGIRHDGILYLGQALNDLDPGRMSDDLFFLYGSQASFTVVPHLYSVAIEWLGIGHASLALLALSLALYFAAVAWVVWPLIEDRLRPWAMLGVFVAAPLYGGHRVFAYGEPFFTARSVAEPIVLFGIGLLLRRRPIVGVLCIGAALFVHPLIAIPGLLVAWCWLVSTDRRWLWAASLALVPLALAALKVAPFDGLFRQYDDAWMAVVQDANPFVFVTNWYSSDWALIVLDVVVLAWTVRCRRELGPLLSKMAGVTLVVGVGGILASWIAADLLSNVLLTGLQLWRTHWLMHWTAMIALPPLLVLLWKRETANDRSAALLLLASIFSVTTFGPLIMAPGAIVLVALRRKVPVTRPIVFAMGALVLGLAAILSIRQVALLSAFWQILGGSLLVQIARWTSVTLVMVGLVWIGMRYLPRRSMLGVAVSAVFLGIAMFGWDQREDWTRYQEDYSSSHGLLWQSVVAPSDRLYWFHEVLAPWLTMHHANYYSPNQASGALFNRRTALELKKRRETTAPLEFQETVCRMMNSLNKKEASCEPDIEAIKDLCTSADNLSFVVLQSILPMKLAGEFRTGFIEHDFEKTFYLYRCSDAMAR